MHAAAGQAAARAAHRVRPATAAEGRGGEAASPDANEVDVVGEQVPHALHIHVGRAAAAAGIRHAHRPQQPGQGAGAAEGLAVAAGVVLQVRAASSACWSCSNGTRCAPTLGSLACQQVEWGCKLCVLLGWRVHSTHQPVEIEADAHADFGSAAHAPADGGDQRGPVAREAHDGGRHLPLRAADAAGRLPLASTPWVGMEPALLLLLRRVCVRCCAVLACCAAPLPRCVVLPCILRCCQAPHLHGEPHVGVPAPGLGHGSAQRVCQRLQHDLGIGVAAVGLAGAQQQAVAPAGQAQGRGRWGAAAGCCACGPHAAGQGAVGAGSCGRAGAPARIV